MKYLANYMEEAKTEAFRKAGAFFAFSAKQFDEQKQGGVEYVNMGSGLVCRTDTAGELAANLENIYQEGIKQDIAENGLTDIILRELNNHEAYYTRDISDTVAALADYPITEEAVEKVFKNKIAQI